MADRHGMVSPFMKTIQTQTDYRDSEAQTDPYTPDYVVQPGPQPELLSLALLSHGMSSLLQSSPHRWMQWQLIHYATLNH